MTPDPAVTAKLMTAVGRPVKFTYPAAEGTRQGTLKDRAVAVGSNTRGVPYYNVIDLIEFADEPEPWVRITYYRHLRSGKLSFAGQYSICEPVSSWERLMAVGGATPWFRPLIARALPASG